MAPLSLWLDQIDSGSTIPAATWGEGGERVMQVSNITADGFRGPYLASNGVGLKTLSPGDIATGRVGSIGTFVVVTDQDRGPFSDNVFRLRLKPEYRHRVRFLAAYLNSTLASQQLERSRKGAVQEVINQVTLRELFVPTLSEGKETSLVQHLEGARTVWRDTLNAADSLLSGLDSVLLSELGIQPPTTDQRMTFAVRLSDVMAAGRLNADYYHPERLLAIRAQAGRTGTRSERLGDIADFIRDTTPADTSRLYLGLSAVEPNTGERLATDEEVGGACFEFRPGDVLFARLRPYLNKVYHAEEAGLCSPEFHVIRLHDPADPAAAIMPDYLAAILRSSLILAQTRHMMTGNTHPRLATSDVDDLVLPIPDLPTQTRIAAEVQRRRTEARRLRAEAATGWEAARARFEAALTGAA